MTAYPAWTPASRPGIIPLHPLSFGTILGRSFTALRQNPKVLLGFALVVQTLGYLVTNAAIVGIAYASFSRLFTVMPGTDDYETLFAGSVAITLIAGFVLGLASGVLGVIVQGIVVAEVAHAAVAEKLTLGALWRQVKPVAWRLVGYAALLVLVIGAAFALIFVALVALGVAVGPAVFALAIPLVLALIPLFLWLSTKLLLVPAAIILEHATIGRALALSWSLTKRRFWPILGVIVLIAFVFGFVAQAVTFPVSLLTSGIGGILAPTSTTDPSGVTAAIVGLVVTQALALLIQSVAIVVQSTATGIIYIDCRMRHEGLDLDLLAYVERRDAGATDLPDPYRQHIGRAVAPRFTGAYPAAPGYPVAPAYPAGYAAPGYGGPGYGAPGYGAPRYGAPAGRPVSAQPPYGAVLSGSPASAQTPAGQPPHAPNPAAAAPSYGHQPPAPQQHAEAPAAGGTDSGEATAEAHPGATTTWAAPGAATDGTDRESPWA
ncbi:hypothetical protein ACFUTX_12685 [Microbacterium sp. NPDC057407]|uniref:hypothetical protein n=1 Tax=Microbacterium sp. NPDC057407 TaxID=3346120 RepID=UPI00366BBFD2